jgi:hypothetical protein
MEKPFRGRSGDRVRHKLQPGEYPTVIAGLTLKIYTTVRGDDRANLHRRLVYLPSGVV